MTRTRIKICGITNQADADNAVACGVDALGFNFFKGSSRYIDPENAAGIIKSVPAFVTTVGLFVDEPMSAVTRITDGLGLGLLQFHGDESAEYCESVVHSYVKAVRATSREQIAAETASYQSARAILLDTAANGQFGGTGKTFDWSIVPALRIPVILAGGLDESNVGQAILATRPYAVDVSGGVEQSKGVKDMSKIKNFVDAVRAADRSINE